MDFPENFIVAIDGPAGSGKSTIAKRMAEKIGAIVIDTGAMYRSVTAKMLDQNINPEDHEAAASVAEKIDIRFGRDGSGEKIIVDGDDFTTRIREPAVSAQVSLVAAHAVVRERMVFLQRRLGAKGRVVMEGRDIGTNVFPGADYKFFIVADDAVRASRRHLELSEAGAGVSIKTVADNLSKRDKIDSTRTAAPLKKADDAIVIDTTDLSVDETLEKMLQSMFP